MTKRRSKRRTGGYEVTIGRKKRRFRLKRAAMKAISRARRAGRKVSSLRHTARVAHKRRSRRGSRRVHSNRRRHSVRRGRRHSRRRRSRR